MRLAKPYPEGPLVLGQDKIVADFVVSRTPEQDQNGFGECSTIGIARDNKLIGGVVYYNWRQRTGDIMVAFAFDSPRWASREVMGSVCAFPFIQLGCQRATAICKKKNTRSRKFVEWLGFKYEGNARRAFGDDDAILYGMLRQECRWIGEK